MPNEDSDRKRKAEKSLTPDPDRTPDKPVKTTEAQDASQEPSSESKDKKILELVKATEHLRYGGQSKAHHGSEDRLREWQAGVQPQQGEGVLVGSIAAGIGFGTVATTKVVAEESDRDSAARSQSPVDANLGSSSETSGFRTQLSLSQPDEVRHSSDEELKDAEEEEAEEADAEEEEEEAEEADAKEEDAEMEDAEEKDAEKEGQSNGQS